MKNNEIIKGIIISIFDAFKRGDTKEIEKHLHEEASVWDVFTPYMITGKKNFCLLYTSPSPRDLSTSRMPSSA